MKGMLALRSPNETVRFLAALVVAALLLCHGAFGALHVVAGPLATSLPAGGHAAGHPSTGAHGGEHLAPLHTCAEYFAVLLGLFAGGSALWLLLRKGRRRGEMCFAPRRFASRPPAALLELPRGPTPPTLQVFRL